MVSTHGGQSGLGRSTSRVFPTILMTLNLIIDMANGEPLEFESGE